MKYTVWDIQPIGDKGASVSAIAADKDGEFGRLTVEYYRQDVAPLKEGDEIEVSLTRDA